MNRQNKVHNNIRKREMNNNNFANAFKLNDDDNGGAS